jgi:hypothetical protein
MFLGVLLTGYSLAQVQTDCSTNGTSSNGNINATTNCTSTDTGAAVAERNRQNAEAGQAMGNAIGVGIAAAIQNHREARRHDVHYPVDEVLARHQDIMDTPMNRVALMEYVKNNHLSPEKNRSWEKAYENLKNSQRIAADRQQIVADSKQQQEFCAKYPRGNFPRRGVWIYCDAHDPNAAH